MIVFTILCVLLIVGTVVILIDKMKKDSRD